MIWNTWQLLNKHSNSLKPWGSFLFCTMNSFSLTPAQNANVDSLWSKRTGDVLLGQRVTPHWCFCLILLFSKNATCSRSIHRGRKWQFWTRKSSKLEILSDILINLRSFPSQPSLCYNILSLLWQSDCLDSYSLSF